MNNISVKKTGCKRAENAARKEHYSFLCLQYSPAEAASCEDTFYGRHLLW